MDNTESPSELDITLDRTPPSPLDTRPRRVAILGLGPSIKDYLGETARKKNLCKIDEVWGINTSHRSFKCDKIWMMDNLDKISQNYPDWANELRLEKTPIITSFQRDDFPTSVAYPLESICKEFQDDYFSTTVAYMIAYAAYIRVDELLLFGVDFHYPNAVIVESGLGGVSYWLGIAKERGVHYKIPASSTLLDANMIETKETPQGIVAKRLLYGYDYNPQDAKRHVEKGNATPSEVEAAGNAYRPVDPTDTEVMKKLGQMPGKPIEVEPK